jgi:hypothetical protein
MSSATARSSKAETAPVRSVAHKATWVTVSVDIACVLAFVIIGRHSHHNGETVSGVWQTAWPFLTGLAIGWLSARAWRHPLSIVPAGIGAWIGAAGLGMLIRVLAGQGTALAFIGVAAGFLAVSLLGWRIASRIVMTRMRAAS